MKKLLLALSLFAGINSLQAQDAPEVDFYRIALKYYPTFLLDISAPSLEGGIEYRINKKWGIQQDFGYISTWDGRYFLATDFMEGFRFRTSIRKYKGSTGNYQALTFGYKRLLRDRTESICRFGCAYFEEFDYQLLTNDFSTHYLFGFQNEFWKFGLVDLNIGAGFRIFKRTRTPDLPEDAFFSGINSTRSLRIRTNRWLFTPSAIISLSIGIGR